MSRAAASPMRHWPLLPIAALALLLRLMNLDYGLPGHPHPDEWRVVRPAVRMAHTDSPDLHPGYFNYPALQLYVLAGGMRIAALASPAVEGRAEPRAELLQHMRFSRGVTAGLSTATVIATYALGWLCGGRVAAVLAGLFLAAAPYPVLDSHYANVDVPMTLWLVLAACASLLYARRRSLAWLAATATAIGLATATKYPALAATPMLAAACVAARREGELFWRALVPAVPAGLLVLAVFAACAPYTWLDFEGFRSGLLEERSHMGEGHLGFDLAPEGWVYQRAAHQLAAGLPFALGVPLYLMALGGLAGLLWRPQVEALVLAAGALPLFALVCLPEVVFVRYLLPLLPFLAVSAAGFGSWLLCSTRRPVVAAGAAAVVMTLSYSVAFSWSQLRSLEPQNGALASQWILEHVPPGPISIAGTPWMLDLHGPEYSMRRFNLERTQLRRMWPEWLVLSSWYEHAHERGSMRGTAEHHFVRSLGSETSPYETLARFECSYLNQALYSALDPSFADQFACLEFSIHRRRGGKR